MAVNTKEGGLETIIVNYLRDTNGYTEGTSELYSKDDAVVKSWLESFLVATQPDKVARSMCFASASEESKFYARLGEALSKRGVNGGAGNPVIPGKTMTSYLWEEIFTKLSLSNIIENFAQVIVTEEKKTHKLKEKVKKRMWRIASCA